MKRTSKLLLILLFLGVLFTFNELVIKDIYNSSSLYGSYLYKAKRAASVTEEKFIIVGGSASNLGFSSQKFEELSGKPAVNLSISAGIPLRVYLKAAENYAQPGDVIILPLEYSYLDSNYYDVNESYIDMVGVDQELKSKETFSGNIDFVWTYFLRSFTKANDCFMFALKQKLGSSNTIYIAKSVDEYGDFVMHKGRTPTYQRSLATLPSTYNEETMRNICNYIDQMSQKGIRVYISYPPVDGACFKNYETALLQIHQLMEKQIGREHLIGSPLDFSYEQEFFFDTCYHLRYEYREIYTKALYNLYIETTS